jgi:hypothetical protein
MATVPSVTPAAVTAALALCGSMGTAGTAEIIVAADASAGAPPSLSRLNQTQALSDEFRGMASRYGGRVADLTPRAYEPGRKPDTGEVAWLTATSVPLLQSIVGALSQPISIPLYVPRGDDSTRLRFSVTSVTSGNRVLHLFRVMSPQARLSRSRRLAVIFRQGTFDELRDEVLLFDDRYDAVLIDGYVLITNQSAFERMFNYLVELQARAATVFDSVTANLRIRRMDQLRNSCVTDVNMMRKLGSIEHRLASNPRYRAAMTMEKLVPFIRNHPHVGIEIQGRGRSIELVFYSDPQRRWQILKLLDDDYLNSELTDLDYEANSKSAPLN